MKEWVKKDKSRFKSGNRYCRTKPTILSVAAF
jgi:hypothetical protein